MLHLAKSFPLLHSKAIYENKEFTVTDITSATIIISNSAGSEVLHWAPSKDAWQTKSKRAVTFYY